MLQTGIPWEDLPQSMGFGSGSGTLCLVFTTAATAAGCQCLKISKGDTAQNGAHASVMEV